MFVRVAEKWHSYFGALLWTRPPDNEQNPVLVFYARAVLETWGSGKDRFPVLSWLPGPPTITIFLCCLHDPGHRRLVDSGRIPVLLVGDPGHRQRPHSGVVLDHFRCCLGGSGYRQ